MYRHRKHRRLQPRPMARLTFSHAHKSLDIMLRKLTRLRIVITPLQSRYHPLIRRFVHRPISKSPRPADFHLVLIRPRPIQNLMSHLFRQLPYRCVYIKPMLHPHRRESLQPPRVLLYSVKWPDSALCNGEIIIKHELRIHHHFTPQPRAIWACPLRRIEREQAW